ncbi:hypothetical protein Vadar_012657 [Vaccinium darrowii]|uniref:Uncharacterized protein n=1 Tax=Vaccinium darrowii TaxID=229202 RepID=A0ACB7YUQ5_9ERIC|nr:hypothetical protein Vadar_012657 [Vaccinium darrowii]
MSANKHCDLISVIEDLEDEVPKMPDPNTGEPEESAMAVTMAVVTMGDLLARAIQTMLLIPCCLCSGLIKGRSYEDPKHEEEPNHKTLEPEEIVQSAQCDIFLSFKGPDARTKIAAQLYKYLKQEGFKTYREDRTVPWGKFIKSELHKVILNSRTSVVILSKNFANSKACLFELQTMLEISKKSNHLILPVFCEIEPKIIEEQAENLNFEDEDEDEKCAALKQVASMAGVVSQNCSSEAELIEDIIRELKRKLADEPLWVGNHPLRSTVTEVHKLRSTVTFIPLYHCSSFISPSILFSIEALHRQSLSKLSVEALIQDPKQIVSVNQ